MSTFEHLSDINPGVRNLVWRLNEHGFHTTDSGDGVTNKPLMGDEALDYPHVVIVVSPPERLVTEARRLRKVLSDFGVDVPAMGMDEDEPVIEAVYDPGNDIATLMLSNVDDSMLT